MASTTKSDFYIQVKIRQCNTPPFLGLNALGLWYGEVLAHEMQNWQSASRSAKLGSARDMAALCENQGYHIRRVSTDGTLLKVYNHQDGLLLEDSLLPISLPGKNMRLIELSDIPQVFLRNGGFRAEVAIEGLAHTGWFLQGKNYNAFWADTGRAFHSENTKRPNTELIRRLGS